MQERKSGFRFQNAEGQRHAAVVAEGKLRPQMVLVHPPGAAARKAVFRRAAFQPDGLYLTERKGAVPAALRKASFAAKSAAALAALWALRGEGAPSESPSAFRSAGPKTLAAKVEPWGPPRLFAIRAVSQRSQPMPYIMICLFSAKTASLICMIKSEKFKQNVQISLGKLEVLPQVVYNKS
jgi:hypothetical protein